jgi:endonuclease/exonuclease/phosphatase family metal-dependent hydrolase
MTDTAEPTEVEDAPATRQRPLGGRPVTIGGWVVVAGFAIWALVRFFGLERGYPFIQLISFTPYVAGAAVAVPLVLVVFRRWVAVAAAAVVATVLVACVAPRWFADGGKLPTGPTLKVMSANLLKGGADPGFLVALVRTQQVDLLALQEFTPEAERALDAAGLAALLPHRSSHPLAGVGGSALYSRFPLRDDGIRVLPQRFTQAKATLTIPGAAPLAVESVHTCAPSAAENTGCMTESFPNEPPATVDGQVRVLLGDFNATLDHEVLRRLLDTGYRDAADVLGDGLTMTWPYNKLFPPIALDHVLADRRIGVRRFAVTQVPRSDHRSVFAELVLPPG